MWKTTPYSTPQEIDRHRLPPSQQFRQTYTGTAAATPHKTSIHLMRIALFPGSFDPFTVGHADIIARALPLFDEIVIAVGTNIHKQGADAMGQRVRHIEALYRNEPRIRVITYNDLTVDLAEREKAQFILRGIRSVKDFEYERDIAATNRQLTGVETVFIFSDPRYAHVSSSLVRELKAFGRDTSQLVPQP